MPNKIYFFLSRFSDLVKVKDHVLKHSLWTMQFHAVLLEAQTIYSSGLFIAKITLTGLPLKSTELTICSAVLR